MRNKRPTNIHLVDLLAYHFPLPAIVSILHRISGFVVFLMIPLLLSLLQASLASETSFITLQECLSAFWVKALLWLVLLALAYHLIAGLKHLVMDFGVGETLAGARRGAWVTLLGSGIAAVMLGVWLW